jgi:hypothetical protein
MSKNENYEDMFFGVTEKIFHQHLKLFQSISSKRHETFQNVVFFKKPKKVKKTKKNGFFSKITETSLRRLKTPT